MTPCRKWLPLLLPLGAAALFLLLKLYLDQIAIFHIPCVLWFLTGLYCPGCGAGRALSALLHLHLVDAIDYNVFFVMALPLAAYYLLKKYIVLVFHRDPLPIFSTSLRTYNIVMLVILGFWILRNIPVFPFTLLAP